MALNIQPPPSTEHAQVVPYRTKVAVPPVEAPAPTCSVVMVSYRTGPVLIDSLRAALEQGAVEEAVLVDKGNGQETRRALEALGAAERRPRILRGSGTVGFAHGRNLGVRAARKCSC